MTNAFTRLDAALGRWLALALLVAIPVAVLSSYLTTALGPMHVHMDDAGQPGSHALGQGAAKNVHAGNVAHDHRHGVFARHRHEAHDRSVIVVASDRADDGAAASESTTGTVRSLPLAPLLHWQLAAAEPDASSWPRLAPARWADHVPPRPERPPRVR